MPDNSYKQQSSDELKLVEDSRALISEGYNYAKEKFRERKVYNDLYYVNNEEYRKLKLDHQAKFLSSRYHAFAEQKICLYAQGITGTDIQPFFIYSPLDNAYATGTAEALTKLAYVDLQNEHYYETNYKTCQHYVVDGIAIERPYWNYREIPRYQDSIKQPIINDDGRIEIIEIQQGPVFVPEVDRVSVKSVPPNDIWHDPKARNEDQLRYIIERHVWTFSYLKQLEREGKVKNVDLLKDTSYPTRGDMDSLINSFAHERKDYSRFYDTYFNSVMDKEDPLIEVLCVWRRGYYYLIGNERVALTGNKSLNWLRRSFPHVFYSNNPTNYRFDGISDFYFNQYVIKETNKVANMLIDNVHKHLNPTRIINGLLPPKDIEDLKSGAPNLVVQSMSSAQIQEYRPDLPSESVMGLLDQMVANTKEDMSITDLMAGDSPGSEFRTTGSIQIAAQMGQIRSAVKLQMLANRKRDIGTMILDLYRDNLSEDKIVTIGGMNTQDLMVIKSDLNFDYNIDVNISPAADILRSYELQAMRALFSDWLQVPGFDIQGAARQMASKSGVFKDGTKLFPATPNLSMQYDMQEAQAFGMPSNTEAMQQYQAAQQPAQNPAFAGANSVQSPDAGGQTPNLAEPPPVQSF